MVERVGHGPAGSAQDDAHEEVPDREERAARQLIMTLADKPARSAPHGIGRNPARVSRYPAG